ncbi:MAG: UDP-glucose--hexose-1-phosphate uridylyltransferase [Terriglobales bacterium]
MLNLSDSSHRRLNPLTGDWVLVSPHRTQRPWLGQMEPAAVEKQPSYDPACYLCPGNERARGVHNPKYDSTFVFDNDFPALLPYSTDSKVNENEKDLIVAQSESGICRVVCFSPRHDLTLAQMTVEETRKVVDVWAEQFEELGKADHISYVQIFENRGAAMGASNPHPHCQIWAGSSVPNEPRKEQRSMENYLAAHHQCLLCEYFLYESAHAARIVLGNEHFQVVVPFWAVWPFETLIIGRRHVSDVAKLNSDERDAYAEILGNLTACYDRLFNTSFPYSMGIHQRPASAEHPEWHMHTHFYPPLLRSATIRKFMVGFEMLGTPQRDITAEDAAARLREVSRRG